MARARIEVNGLRVKLRIGVTDAELEVERTIVIDLSVLIGRPEATATDALEDTIDYAALARIAAGVASERPYRTLERLAGRISEEIGARVSGVEGIEVSVAKPDPPIDENVDSVTFNLRD